MYISLYDNDSRETKRIWLNKSNATDKEKKQRNLFEAGQVDEFLVQPSFNLENVKKIRIGHDNSGLASGWHLNKVELVNVKKSLRYLFDANRWLAKDEGDKNIEVILYARDEKKQQQQRLEGKDSRLKVEVIHDLDSDTEATLPIFSASSKGSNGSNEDSPKNGNYYKFSIFVLFKPFNQKQKHIKILW